MISLTRCALCIPDPSLVSMSFGAVGKDTVAITDTGDLQYCFARPVLGLIVIPEHEGACQEKDRQGGADGLGDDGKEDVGAFQGGCQGGCQEKAVWQNHVSLQKLGWRWWLE